MTLVASNTNLTIVIATIDRPQAVRRLVRSIRQRYPETPILVGEQLQDPDASALKGIDADVLYFPYDYGVGATRGALASRVLTDYFVLCDDDFIFGELTDLTPAIDILDRRPSIGIVGGLLFDVFDDGGLNERNPRHWEKWIHFDRARKTLLLMPIAYELPEYSYLRTWRYLHADAVMNWAVMRTSLFRDGTLGWDARFKIAGEHEDFYLQRKLTAPQVEVVYCPDLIAYHHHALSHHGSDYLDLRSRLDGWTIFRRKWGIDRVIDIDDAAGNCVDTVDTIIYPTTGGYNGFIEQMNKRSGRLSLAENSVGIDANGRLYCDPSRHHSANRAADRRLFLCERTAQLRIAHSAVGAGGLRPTEGRPHNVDVLVHENSYLKDLVRENSYLKDRSIWARLLFRPSGRPIRPLRRILFHNNGKPRGILRKYVLRVAAKPGTALHYWMTRPAYLGLPRAVRPYVGDRD